MENETIKNIETKLNEHIQQHGEDYKVLEDKIDKMAEKQSSIWWKIIGIIAVPLIAGLIGYGSLQQKVANDNEKISELIESKANKETVENQFASVNQSLGRIEAILTALQQRK